jgi:periplasmic copper chaperone A
MKYWLAAAMAIGMVPAWAHDFKAGSVRLDHPYAAPTVASASNGAVYFREIRNNGDKADALISARSPAAKVVEIHRTNLQEGVMRMRHIPELELAPGQVAAARHDAREGGVHLMLIGVTKPLIEGETFPLTLKFRLAGEVEVKVVVQRPKQGAEKAAEHKHH